MAQNIISSLELDKESLDGKVIIINENSGCDANFFFSCLMSKQIKEGGGICLVNVHNDFNHFHNIGLKIGYNLNKLKDVGSIHNIDFLQMVSDAVSNNVYDKCIDLTSDNESSSSLYKLIENTLFTLHKTHKSVCIIIDDITNFLNLNYTMSDINKFVQKCKSLTLQNTSSFIMGLHTTSTNNPNYAMIRMFYYIADIVCEVSPLSTGRSVDVSGSFKIIRPWINDDLMTLNKNTSMNYYLFKLFDRGVKVFAPGLR